MNVLLILAGYLSITAVIAAECFLDRWLTKKFDVDGIRTDLEDALLHWAQVPFRGFLVWAVAHYIMPGALVLNILALVFYYALVFDASYNKFVLKVAINHVGTTARTDKLARVILGNDGWVYLIIKTSLAIVFFTFIV